MSRLSEHVCHCIAAVFSSDKIRFTNYRIKNPKTTIVTRKTRILDTVNRAWRRPEDEQLHVVQHERHDLQEARRRTGQTLQNDIGEEERRRLGQVLREQGGDRCGVVN